MTQDYAMLWQAQGCCILQWPACLQELFSGIWYPKRLEKNSAAPLWVKEDIFRKGFMQGTSSEHTMAGLHHAPGAAKGKLQTAVSAEHSQGPSTALIRV